MAGLSQVNGTALVQLTMAMCDYAHTRELAQGIVRADGIVLTPLVFPSIEEITFRFTKHLEWDVSELSMGKYIALASAENAPMIAIPVFPSRMHRHSAIYVRSDRAIKSPKDLHGRTVGIPEWAQTAGIYVRGFLAEEYGVDLSAIQWVQAGVNEAGRDEKVKINIPQGIRYTPVQDKSLSTMLETGEIDAVISARTPECVHASAGKITRLFEDSRSEEVRFFEKTRIFPIMHVMAIRRSVFEQYPWIAANLVKAFVEAKQRCLRLLADFTCARAPLPWIATFTNEILSTYGSDPYPYGIDENRATLDAFCRYAYEQGIAVRTMAAADLFPPQTYKTVRV